MAEPTYEELKARLSELEKQQGTRRSGSLEFRVGEKGGVSVYGLGRFPVTLYYEQWIRLLDSADKLRHFRSEERRVGEEWRASWCTTSRKKTSLANTDT